MATVDTWTFIAIGLALFLWGGDKVFEYAEYKYPKHKDYVHNLKLVIGCLYFAIGIIFIFEVA